MGLRKEYIRRNIELNYFDTKFDKFQKAFDKIMHTEMWTALEEIGIPQQYLTAIQGIYANPKFRV